MARRVAITALLLVAVLGIEPIASAAPRTTSPHRVAWQMAQLDLGFVPFNDPVVQRYMQPLLGMIHGCHDTASQIGDEATVAKRILARHGHEFTYLQLIRLGARSIPLGGSPVQCDEILASLVVLILG